MVEKEVRALSMFASPSRSAPWMALDAVEIRAIVQDARWQAGLSTQAHFSSSEADFPQPTPRTVQVAASAAEIRSLRVDVAQLIGDTGRLPAAESSGQAVKTFCEQEPEAEKASTGSFDEPEPELDRPLQRQQMGSVARRILEISARPSPQRETSRRLSRVELESAIVSGRLQPAEIREYRQELEAFDELDGHDPVAQPASFAIARPTFPIP